MILIECMVPGECSVFKRFYAISMDIVYGWEQQLPYVFMNYSLLVSGSYGCLLYASFPSPVSYYKIDIELLKYSSSS